MANPDRINMPPHILELLDDMEFPATKTEIVEYALEQDGAEEAMDILEAMPDRLYEDLHDLSDDIGMIEDLPGTDNGYWPASEEASLPDETESKVTKFRGTGKL